MPAGARRSTGGTGGTSASYRGRRRRGRGRGSGTGTDSGNSDSGAWNSVHFGAGGDRIAFASMVADLGPTDTNRTVDVYVRDLTRGVTLSLIHI